MDKGFFGSLFDLSFKSLITTKIIKVIYVLWMIVIGLGALGLIVSGFSHSAATGLLVLIVVAPLLALVYLILARVWLEIVIVLFRIMENTQQLVALGERIVPPTALAGASPPPAAPPPVAPPPGDPAAGAPPA